MNYGNGHTIGKTFDIGTHDYGNPADRKGPDLPWHTRKGPYYRSMFFNTGFLGGIRTTIKNTLKLDDNTDFLADVITGALLLWFMYFLYKRIG